MNELLTAEELGKRLRLRPDTIKSWARRGLIPSIRATNKTRRFDIAEVIEALRRRHGSPGSTLSQDDRREVGRHV